MCHYNTFRSFNGLNFCFLGKSTKLSTVYKLLNSEKLFLFLTVKFQTCF